MKRISKVLAMVCAFFMFTMTVCAEEAMEVYVGDYETAESIIQIQVSNNLTDENLQPQYSVSLGGSTLDILSVEAGAEEVSYLFLVDISGSIKSGTRKQMEDAFNNLIAYMGFDDNAGLMFVGNETHFNDFTGDREALVRQFTDYKVSGEDTNLYYAIEQALTILDTSEKCYDRKCLVVLSDGEDDKIDGITAEEVKTKIEEVKIPVFCIETLGNNPSDSKVENAKITGSFARLSPGGINFIYGENGVDGQTAAAQISESMKDYKVITADLSKFIPGTSNTLEVSMTVAEKGTAKDGYDVNMADIEKVLPVKEETTEATPEKEEESTKKTEPVVVEEEETNWIVPVIVGGSVLGLVMVLVAGGRKKKNVKEQNVQPDVPMQVAQPQEKVIIKEVRVLVPEPKEEKHYEADVILTKMGNFENEQVSLHIKDRITIGRVAGRADVVWTEDDLLSGVHCALECNENGVYITDLNSTNGTMLNGIPVTEARKVESGDTVAMGSYEWRVEIK